MEESIRVAAKTVEDAITEASIQLCTSRDNIDYTVIEKGTSGFFGIGGKKAVIEARKRVTDEDIIKEVFGEEEKPKKEKKKEEPRKEFKKEAKKEFKKEKKEFKKEFKEEKKEFKKEVKKEFKQEEKAPKKEVKKEQPQIIQESPKNDTNSKTPRVPADPEEAARRAEEFLKNVFHTMDTEVEITTTFEEETLSIDMAGDNMGLLIGKRGQTLDSLQYLTSLVVNKGKASYVRVKLDTEDYRNRRKATLENLAKNIAFKVKKTRRPVFLEPMNPYERRIIHSALQNDPYVTTHSEGDEPCRKVVVTLKKKQSN